MTVVAVFAAASLAAAEQAKSPAEAQVEKKAAASAAKVTPAEPAALPVNVRIEVSITDQTATGTPAKKVVTMITSDRQSNSIRSSASVPVKINPGSVQYRNVTINVDARPTLVAKEPNKVLVSFGLEYLPKSAGGSEELEPGGSQLNERLTLVLESGKTMIVSQAADPTSDRKITVEVTATILR